MRDSVKRIVLLFLLLLIPLKIFCKDLEVTFWHSLGFHVKEIVEEMAYEYNQDHPGIKVTPVFQGLYDEMQVKMLAAAVTHDLPDVAQVQFEYMNAYIENNLIDPIDGSIPQDQKNDILDILWELTRRNGRIYGVPFCISTTVFFYNEDLFSSAGVYPPSTWEEMIRVGKKLTEDTDGDGIPDRYAMMFWIDGFYGIAPFLWAHGGEFFSEDGTRIVLTSNEMVQTITMLRDLVFTHEIMPRNWTDWEGAQGFLSGRLAMGPFTSAAISYGEQNLPWTLKVIPIPTVNGKRYTVLGGSCLVNFSKSNKMKRIANEFIFWLVSKENTIRMHEKVGYVPVRKSALDSLELRAFDRQNPNFKVPIESLDYARPLPNHPEYFKINEQIREMLQRVFLNASDPVLELENAEEKINMMLKG